MDIEHGLHELRVAGGNVASCAHEFRLAKQRAKMGEKRSGIERWRSALWRAARAYAKIELRMQRRRAPASHADVLLVLLAYGFEVNDFDKFYVKPL